MLSCSRIWLALALLALTVVASAQADKPSPRTRNFEWMALHTWFALHAEDVKLAHRSQADLVFLGDSITQGWDGMLWQKHFAPYDAVNFGIGGDLTQNLLWRLQNGTIGYLQPRLVVMMIGVNNFGHDDASVREVFRGVKANIREIETHYPLAKILLLGILPYGEKDESNNRKRVRKANQLLKTLAKKDNIIFRDYGHLFLQKDGTIPRKLMPDLLHPNAHGYALLAEALEPEIRKLLPLNPVIPVTSEQILIEGRTAEEDGSLKLAYPGVSLHFRFQGKALSLVANSSGKNLLDVYLNGELKQTLTIGKQTREYILLSTESSRVQDVELVHRSETWHGVLNLEGLKLHGGRLQNPAPLPKRTLLFIGDSITCGEAVQRGKSCDKAFSWWDPELAYGKLLGEQLNAQTHLVCFGGRGLMRSWNGNTEDMQAPEFFHLSIPRQTDAVHWEHTRYQPDLIFIALGTNDFNLDIGPFPPREDFVTSYLAFLQELQVAHPQARIVISEGPMVNDEVAPERRQRSTLQAYLRDVANQTSGEVTYLPSKVYPGDKCDAHPTAKQHRKLAHDLAPKLQSLMGW